MTEIEEKCLKAQIKLLEDINNANSMILNIVKSTASEILNNVVDRKTYTAEGQTTIKL